jgi:hypothetical protein
MKIGILTYHSVPNFGANLQVYSTVGYLRNIGAEPIVINWVAKELDENYGKGNPSEQIEAHRNFIKNYLPLSELCRTTEDVASVIKTNNIECVVIGSDVVLQHKTLLSRMKITKRGIQIKQKRANITFPNPFWGSFIPLIDKKITVALMSAASQNMPYFFIRGSLKQQIGEALLRFNHVFVRDDFTRNMITYFTKEKLVPDITPDPVFAFNQNITNQLSKAEIQSKFDLPEKYVLFSFKNKNIVTENWLKSCLALLEKNNLTGVILTMPGGVIFKNLSAKVIAPPLNPMEWYNLIRYSSGYIGENMHPIVVSLHNSVPFFAFDDYGTVRMKYFVNEKSSKIHNILSIAGFLENRVGTLGKKYSCPTPEKVIGLITDFNFEKCNRFSDKQLSGFNKMMESIIKM